MEISLAQRRMVEAEKEKEASLKMERISLDWQSQMSTPHGRRVMWRILKKLMYDENVQNYNASAYGSIAKQEVARDIARELKLTCRELFYVMETENEKER